MNLQTKIPLKKQSHHLIDYTSNILLLGSCFSENVGSKFKNFKFQSNVNSHGILFHPVAIERFITRAINSTLYTEEDLYFNNEQWCCLEAHSKFNSASKDTILQQLNASILSSNNTIGKASHIIITLGTGWVYRHIASDTIVANCHKMPQKHFLKELLTVNTIYESLDAIVELIRTINPDVKFIFTVSPVRHLKDGFIENTQSKAHLITAIHKLLNLKPALSAVEGSDITNHKSFYFPAYEIMMDELRDYRFYNADMIHPNSTAIDYIWGKFSATWLSESTLTFMDKIDSIQKRKAHKAFNPQSEAHKKFLNTLKTDIEELKLHLPKVNFNG